MKQHALALALGLAVVASPALAHHRQTPPLVQITKSGETALPRLRVWGQVIVVAVGDPGSKQVFQTKIRTPTVSTPVSTVLDSDNPVANKSGGVLAWDKPAANATRQVVRVKAASGQEELLSDPNGTATDPAIDTVGMRVAWETVANGVSSIMYRDATGTRQVSKGLGQSHHPVVGPSGRVVAFDSTSDPADGHDTGIAQIYMNADRAVTTLVCVTCGRHGAGNSDFPGLSEDNRALVFQSTADLVNDGHDTGVSQVYLYDTQTQNFARITNDAAGCTLPTVQKITLQGISGEYRVAYTCGGQAYFYDVRRDIRKHLLIDGDTNRIVTEMGNHFFILTTTANLTAGSGQTAGHQVYLWNEFKKEKEIPNPVEDISNFGTAAWWFPNRGIPPK